MIALIYPPLEEVLIRGREVTQSEAEAAPQGLPWPHSSSLVSGEPHTGFLGCALWGKAEFPFPSSWWWPGEAAGLDPA